MKLHTPADTAHLTISGTTYEPDANGEIIVNDESHVSQLLALGCQTEEQVAVAQLAADAPVPEDYLDPAVVHALTSENEELQRELGEVKSEFTKLSEAYDDLRRISQEQMNTIDQLRAVPEKASETTADVPATIDTGTDPATSFVDLSALSYEDLKAWLATNGVTVSGNIAKDKALDLAKARQAELAA